MQRGYRYQNGEVVYLYTCNQCPGTNFRQFHLHFPTCRTLSNHLVQILGFQMYDHKEGQYHFRGEDDSRAQTLAIDHLDANRKIHTQLVFCFLRTPIIWILTDTP